MGSPAALYPQIINDEIDSKEIYASFVTFHHSTSDSFRNLLSAKKEQLSTVPNVIQEDPEDNFSNEVDFLNPPLTRFIRHVKSKVEEQRELIFERLKNDFPGPGIKKTLNEQQKNQKDTLTIKSQDQSVNLFNRNINIDVDGGGFIDASWEKVLDKGTLKMWRKLVPVDDKAASRLHEYRITCSFKDISAQVFLEVQLNLDLRKRWDTNVTLLKIEEHFPFTSTDKIRWISKFPFPMANREYLFARRWVLSHALDPLHKPASQALIVCRATINANGLSGSKNGLINRPIRVSDYTSLMLLRPHSSFEEKGMDFYLIYFDDPQLEIPGKTASWMTTTAIPRFVDQVHRVAHQIQDQGLPKSIVPVLMPPGDKQNDLSVYRDETITEAATEAFYGTSLYPTWMPKYYIEAVHTIFT